MSIFSAPSDALAELASVRLSMISGSKALSRCLDPGPATNSFLSRKLQAAEAEVARRLAVFLEPTEIFPAVPPTDEELAALNGKPYAVEPAYDLPSEFITTSGYGFMQLNQRPLIAVSSVRVIHPNTNGVIYDIPLGWLHLDRKHGQMSIAPGGLASSQPVSMFQLQAHFLGQEIPHAVHIRYRAGLEQNSPYLADVQDLVLRLAALRTLHDQFLPQSGSISADGLSQSTSQDLSKHQDAVNSQLEDLRDAINGPMLGVL